jgi:YegS/Rv2252/BmrU family lipid kinase
LPFDPERGRRALVIFNPVAGMRRRVKLNRILALLEGKGCAVTLRETAAKGDAEAIAREADPSAFDVVVAAGGDGTINEIINGLGLAHSHLPLALIPLGTANVLAAELGLELSPGAIAETVARGAPARIYLGNASGRRFAMMIGVGIDARVVEGLDPRLKRVAGKLAYVWSALDAIARYRPARYQVEIDGERYAAAAAVIAKGRFYAGRFVLAPRANLGHASLQIVLLERAGRWNLLRYGVALARGRLDRLSDVRVIEAHRASVFGPEGEAVQADGDLAGTLPLIVTVSDRPLAILENVRPQRSF